MRPGGPPTDDRVSCPGQAGLAWGEHPGIGRRSGGCRRGDDEWEVGPGSCYYIPKGVPHWLRDLDPVEPVELVGVYLGPGSLEETGYVFLGEVEERDMKVQ